MTLPLAQASTIPDSSGGPYVAAAYVVFVVVVVLYLAIMAQRLSKISKQADELEQRVAQLTGGDEPAPGPAPQAAAPAEPVVAGDGAPS